MTDEHTGRRRQAYADELTQPQELFLFYACEERRKQRNDGGDSGGATGSPSGAAGGSAKTTHHIG